MPTLIAPPPAPESEGTFPKLAEYLGQIVVLEPTEELELDTSYKKSSPATRCVGWAFVGGKLVDLGDLLIFWRKVRAQLHDAIESKAVVVGRIVKDGRSYTLEPADDAIMEKVRAALDF